MFSIISNNVDILVKMLKQKSKDGIPFDIYRYQKILFDKEIKQLLEVLVVCLFGWLVFIVCCFVFLCIF